MTTEYETTTLDLLRHGECEGGHIFRGTTDVPLLPSGLALMKAVSHEVLSSKGGWDVVVSSPKRRCLAFSESLTKEQKIPLVIEPLLAEMNFGEWEGKEISQVWNDYPNEMAQWSGNPSKFTPPKGESITSVYERVKQFYSQLLEQYRSQRILLVTHGGIIRVFLTHLLNMSLANVNRFDVPYAAISRFSIFHSEQEDIVKLIAHNFCGHHAFSAGFVERDAPEVFEESDQTSRKN